MKIILLSTLFVLIQNNLSLASISQSLIPQKIIIKKDFSEKGSREVFLVFENQSEKIIQTPSIIFSIDSKKYKGGVFAKTTHGFHLNYPIRNSQKGAIIFKIKDKTWKQCQKIKVEIPQIIKDKKQKSKVENIYLRVEDQNYASNCAHLN